MATPKAIQKFYEASKARTASAVKRLNRELEARPVRRGGVAVSAAAGAALGGYIDGTYDEDGEGLKLGPVKVIPVLGLVGVATSILSGSGRTEALPGAEYIGGVGLGMFCGYLYDAAKKKGQEG